MNPLSLVLNHRLKATTLLVRRVGFSPPNLIRSECGGLKPALQNARSRLAGSGFLQMPALLYLAAMCATK